MNVGAHDFGSVVVRGGSDVVRGNQRVEFEDFPESLTDGSGSSKSSNGEDVIWDSIDELTRGANLRARRTDEKNAIDSIGVSEGPRGNSVRGYFSGFTTLFQ